MLKLQTSKKFLSEVTNKYANMPFNLRYFEDEKRAKMGVNECVNHKLVEPFQVLYEKPSKFYAPIANFLCILQCQNFLNSNGWHNIEMVVSGLAAEHQKSWIHHIFFQVPGISPQGRY